MRNILTSILLVLIISCSPKDEKKVEKPAATPKVLKNDTMSRDISKIYTPTRYFDVLSVEQIKYAKETNDSLTTLFTGGRLPRKYNFQVSRKEPSVYEANKDTFVVRFLVLDNSPRDIFPDTIYMHKDTVFFKVHSTKPKGPQGRFRFDLFEIKMRIGKSIAPKFILI